jgi:hypothetical protein
MKILKNYQFKDVVMGIGSAMVFYMIILFCLLLFGI